MAFLPQSEVAVKLKRSLLQRDPKALTYFLRPEGFFPEESGKRREPSSGHNVYCVGTWLRRPNHQNTRIIGVSTSVIKSVTADALLIPPPYQ